MTDGGSPASIPPRPPGKPGGGAPWRPSPSRWQKCALVLLGLGAGAIIGSQLAFLFWFDLPLSSKQQYITVQDEILGWALMPGSERWFKPPESLFTAARIRINSLGLRGPDIDSSLAGEERVLVLGGSLAFGYGIDEKNTLAAALENTLRAGGTVAQVCNGGVPTYSLDQSILFARRILPLLYPHLVILVHESTMVTTTEGTGRAEESEGGRPVFLRAPDGTLTIQYPSVEAGSPFGGKGAVPARSIARRLMEGPVDVFAERLWPPLRPALQARGWGYPSHLDRAYEAEAWRRTEELLLLLERAVSEAGGNLMIVLAPLRREIFPTDEWDGVRKLWQKSCEKHAWSCLDLHPIFKRELYEKSPPFFLYRGHWNPHGHAVAASTIAAYLREERLVPAAGVHGSGRTSP